VAGVVLVSLGVYLALDEELIVVQVAVIGGNTIIILVCAVLAGCATAPPRQQTSEDVRLGTVVVVKNSTPTW